MTLEEKSMAYAENRLRTAYPNMTTSRLDKAVDLFDTYDIEQAYEDGATEALASQWVSVKDALPEFDERVLVRCVEYDRPSMFIARRIPYDLTDKDNTKWHWTQVVRDETITHWMRIPPVKGGEE